MNRMQRVQRMIGPERVRKILKRTLAALVADGAVQRMVDQQELEHARARRHDVGRIRMHHHPLGAHRRARRLQLAHLLDLDETDATGAVDAEARVVAVIRNFVAVLDRGLKQGGALLNRDRLAIYRERNGVHIRGIIPRRGRIQFRRPDSPWGPWGAMEVAGLGAAFGGRR